MERGERFNTISHLAGAALALTGLVLLVVRAAVQADPWKITASAIYGFSLVLLYLASTLYHGARGPGKNVLRKLDHAAIYLLIAGTYTPFTLIILRGPWGWSLFGVIWGLAAAGMLQDILRPAGPRRLSLVLYVLMGWLCLAAIVPLLRGLPRAGVAWLASGGLLYTAGIVFYVLDRSRRHDHGVFHLFVLAGSVCHYLSIYLYVV